MPAHSVVPDPPTRRTPRVEVLPAGTRLWRIYRHTHVAPTDFDARDVSLRFRPVRDGAGSVVPTLYAALAPAGAYFETVFRAWNEDEPGGPVFSIGPADVRGRAHAELVTRRELRFAQLYGEGLTRLHVSRERLIVPSSPTLDYPRTAAWAQWLWERSERVDGLLWVSRRHDGVRSLVLFGDRVAADDLELVAITHLDRPKGFAEVQRIATDCGIHVSFAFADL